MDKRLFRLTIVVAVLSFIGFGGLAAYYKHQYDGWSALMKDYPHYASRSFYRCGETPTPRFVETGQCRGQAQWNDKEDEPARMPERLRRKFHEAAWAAELIPLGVCLLYVGCRLSAHTSGKRRGARTSTAR